MNKTELIFKLRRDQMGESYLALLALLELLNVKAISDLRQAVDTHDIYRAQGKAQLIDELKQDLTRTVVETSRYTGSFD